ncbi:unnamed protein product, partial [Mesorhabditis spiculigera]
MTFFHFINCLALAFGPYFLVYKYSGLNEYSSVWKLGQAVLGYFLTQLFKLLLLATLFPTSATEGFALFPELLKSSADVFDVIGLHLIINYLMTGKSEIRFATAGFGYALANSFSTRIIYFWVGARATAFSWQYIQSALDSSSELIFWGAVATLAWLVRREYAKQTVIYALLAAAVFSSFTLHSLQYIWNINAWVMVILRAVYSIGLAAGTVYAYATNGSNATRR